MKTNRVMNRDWRKKVAWFNAIVIFLIPLIVFYKRIEITEELKMYFGNVEAIGDFFAYYKAKLLQFGAPTSLALTIYFKRKEGWKFKWDRYTILLALFSCSIILSTIMSEHKMVAIFGYPDRFEGAWTWLSYLMFSYSIYLFVESKEDIINTIKPFVYATGVASFIGVLQFAGFDLFNTNFGKWLILGPNYNALAEQLVFKFSKGTVYTTLYNPNYIGTMVAMVIPVIIYLFNEFEDSVHKMVMVLILVLNIVALIGSKSTGGFVGTAIVIFIIAVYFAWHSKYRMKIIVASVLLLFIMIMLVINTSLFGKQLDKLKILTTISDTSVDVIKDVQIDGPNMKVVGSDGEEINIYHDNKNIFVYDKDGKLISDKMDDRGYFIAYQPPYEKWLVRYISDNNNFQVYYRENVESDWYSIVTHVVEGGYSNFGTPIINEDLNVKNVNFFKNERVLSNRGYIWNRSLPLIYDSLIVGEGSDTFALVFPQNDMIGKVNIGLNQNLIIDKVHNYYLGLILNFGLLGILIMILIIIGSFTTKSSILLNFLIVGFLVTGVVNDSTVLLSYFFFIIIGIINSQREIVI